MAVPLDASDVNLESVALKHKHANIVRRPIRLNPFSLALAPCKCKPQPNQFCFRLHMRRWFLRWTNAKRCPPPSCVHVYRAATKLKQRLPYPHTRPPLNVRSFEWRTAFEINLKIRIRFGKLSRQNTSIWNGPNNMRLANDEESMRKN